MDTSLSPPPVPPQEGSTKQKLRLCPRKKTTTMMKKEAVVLLLPPAKNLPQRTLSNKRVVGQPQHPPSSSNSSLSQPSWNVRTLQKAETLRKEVMGLFSDQESKDTSSHGPEVSTRPSEIPRIAIESLSQATQEISGPQ
ncbi:hypothetical protein MRX96_027341 [Rhipicephalus microplus]